MTPKQTQLLTLVCASFTGDANAIAPQMVLIDSVSVRGRSKLTGIHLSSSARLISTTLYAGVFVLVGHTEPMLSLSQALNIVAQQVVTNTSNLIGNQAQDEWLPLYPGPIIVESGQPISLYVTLDLDTRNVVTATAALQLVDA
jgi:hypothetical protein